MAVYGKVLEELLMESISEEEKERKQIISKINNTVRKYIRSNKIPMNSSVGWFKNKEFKKGNGNEILISFNNIIGDVMISALFGSSVPCNVISSIYLPKLRDLLKSSKCKEELDKLFASQDYSNQWNVKYKKFISSKDVLVLTCIKK